jgi:hypothetical protein
MNNKLDSVKPKKIVQIFSKIQQEKFRHLSAKERLAWLEDVKSLYWKTIITKNRT